ncbi:hypothetical protein PF003_g19738 [Phytophthora fragariae]|nr:hypothetical protein PF003_g19738 [Phytophthora fragariae]
MIVAEDAASIAVVETHASDSTSDARAARYAAQSFPAREAAGNPVAPLVREFSDIFPDKVPAALPPDRGVRHEVDFVPGAKYCVTRQWPLPRDQVEAIDAFFKGRRQAGDVRESLSPHSSPTFCVKKATGRWRIVHAFNKLNDATIPAQTPIPRKDMVLDTMSGSTKFSAIELMDGFYQTLMRESDVPLTAVSTPSGMLWEWLVMPQGLKNAPATFNRMVSNLLRPYRDFAPSYFDDIFIHSRAAGDMTDVEMPAAGVQSDEGEQAVRQLEEVHFFALPRSQCSGATSARRVSVLTRRRSKPSALGPCPRIRSNSGSGLVSQRTSTTTRKTSRQRSVRCRSFSRQTPRGRGVRSTKRPSTR